MTPNATADLFRIETRTERKERSQEVVRLAPEYEGRLRSTGPDLKCKVRVSLTFRGWFAELRIRVGSCIARASNKKAARWAAFSAPGVGLEPTTIALTGRCSAN